MRLVISPFFFFNDTATTEIYTLSLHDALPICYRFRLCHARGFCGNTSDADAHEEISLQNVERPRERTSDPICFFAKRDRKSTRLNSSHQIISYAVFCLKKKKSTTLSTSYPENH